ncbi:MAG: hypothetical protein ACXVCP_10505 [Bdellovibrio sp.]
MKTMCVLGALLLSTLAFADVGFNERVIVKKAKPTITLSDLESQYPELSNAEILLKAFNESTGRIPQLTWVKDRDNTRKYGRFFGRTGGADPHKILSFYFENNLWRQENHMNDDDENMKYVFIQENKGPLIDAPIYSWWDFDKVPVIKTISTGLFQSSKENASNQFTIEYREFSKSIIIYKTGPKLINGKYHCYRDKPAFDKDTCTIGYIWTEEK